MSLQIRISSFQDRRPTQKNHFRHIVRINNIPESPGAAGPICDAVEIDGRPCKISLEAKAADPWCPKHHQEWKNLNSRWSKAVKDAEKIVVVDSEAAKQKVIKLRLSVDLRRQIRDRFYPRGGDIQDYIKWIAKLETDVRQLADSLLSRHLST